MLTKTALMDTVFYNETPAFEEEKCEIRITGNEIVISYRDDDDVIIYKGKDEGQDHWQGLGEARHCLCRQVQFLLRPTLTAAPKQ